MRRYLSILFIIAIALPLAAQEAPANKEARDKYQTALKELPRDPLKAEKHLKEAIAADPAWTKPQIQLGDLYSALHRWEDAATTYAKLRDLDAQHNKLSDDDRHRVLDGLGIAQAQAGHYDQAIQTYNKALKSDPEYPLYEYNLSCTYAEKGDLDAALTHLKRAWELKANMPQGMKFPDPRKDNSFRRYWSDQRFLDAVENMVI